jgi:hypothetical protein
MTKPTTRSHIRFIFLSVLLLNAAPRSIRDVDFKNTSYPFIESDSVPDSVRWMPINRQRSISLKSGRHVFVSEDCRESPSECPTLTLDRVKYGELTGMAQESALVAMTYHTGGTATWQYLYVVAWRSGMPEVVAWLETGSRADKGLRNASIERGDLVLVVNDPAKREADCCSSGTITTRYRWREGSFQQIGQSIFKDAVQ